MSTSSTSLIGSAGLQSPSIGDISTQAVSASFSAGTLSVMGDALGNTIDISRNAAGQLLVNGGATPVQGATATIANTSLIQVYGQNGDDVITLNEANGALPRANLFGGAGNDTLTAGSGADQLFGQSGNDTLLGKGGNDLLFGGADNDVLTGGDGNDQLFGESGNDRMIWNPGDDSDLMEGGKGSDTAEVNGGNGNEIFSASANGTRVRFDRVDPAPFALDIGTTEQLVVNMNGGDDSFSAIGNLSALIQLTVDGGAGNDAILGGNGADLLIGGDGNDFIDGNQGNDTAFLGAGDDVFGWDPGDGSDKVEGQDGSDTLRFNGSNGDEAMQVSANGARARLTRNLGNVTMDLNDVERIDIAALGGVDSVIVNDLSGTDVTQVNVALASPLGSGDGAADSVVVNATNGNDNINIFGAGAALSVLGLAAVTQVTDIDGVLDSLVVNAGGGNDSLTATTLPAGVAKLTLDGGAGNDTLFGSQGADVLIGGDGNDLVFGDNGNDLALMGAGDDVFQWNPGDGNDTVEGQDGNDTLQVFGANIGENIDIVANGARTMFTRNVGTVVMDVDGVEHIDFRALAGADNVVVGDLVGTDVTAVAIDLRGANGGPDGEVDTIAVTGTGGADIIGVTGSVGGVSVLGLQARVDMVFHDGTDRLTLNAGAGDDAVNASGLAADGLQLTLNGGLGADTLIAGQGNDLVVGGDGNDTALMGAGDDSFVWNPGDDNDTVEGQAGFDTLRFNGANVAENIDIAANGGRVRFFRDIANVTMDLDDTESIHFAALGGTDRIVVGDLSGTDATDLRLDLGAPGGGADAQADQVVVRGTQGDDVIVVVSNGSTVEVLGLQARVVIENFDVNLDTLLIEGLSGDDVIEASALPAGSLLLRADGGAGDDILLGGGGDDVLIGGDGEDVLLGGGGLDTLDGEIVIQNLTSGLIG